MAQSKGAVIAGVPMATSYALDRLDRSDISSARVAEALRIWQQTASPTRAQLSLPNNDWALLIGPIARNDLERALRALPQRSAAALRLVVERADESFRSKTLNNPRADPSQPWWARRWGA
jgi:hypothetical protein